MWIRDTAERGHSLYATIERAEHEVAPNLTLEPVEERDEFVEDPWNDPDDDYRRQSIEDQHFAFAYARVYSESSSSE